MAHTTRRATMVTMAATAAGAGMSGPAQSQQAGGPLDGGPLASGAHSGPFTTQLWLGGSHLQMAGYVVERVTYASQNVPVVGNLFLPSGEGRKPAIIVIGPVELRRKRAIRHRDPKDRRDAPEG